MHCRIITGGRGCGKTHYLLSLIEKGEKAQGFLSLHEGDSYYLRNIETGEKKLLMTTSELFAGRIGRYYYDEKLFREACSSLSSIDNGSVFIDEIGRLELSGGGFDKGLRSLLGKNVSLTLTVRCDFLSSVIASYNLGNAEIISVEAPDGA